MLDRSSRLKNVIDDYNADEITLKKPDKELEEPGKETDVVGDMAKNATDLGAKL